MFPRKSEFKALKDKSTRLSGTHSERHRIAYSPVWDTEPSFWEYGENILGQGKHHNTFSYSPHKTVLMQKQPWLKDMLLSTNHIPWQSSKQAFNCFSGWGLLYLFPNNIASHCQSYQELNAHISSLIPKSQFRKKSLPQSTCTCA